jgi:nucleoside-diphosphate kinase
MIKPDATQRHLIGKILAHYEAAGLHISKMVMKKLTAKDAEGFYAEHSARPFFPEIVASISSAPVVLLVLKGENAVLRNREIMGATDPKQAAPGTLRALFGKSIGENSVHGSDSTTSAVREINFFFPEGAHK